MKTLAFIALGFFLACAIGALAGVASRMSSDVDRTPTEVMVAERAVEAGNPAVQTRTLMLPANWVTESMIRASDWSRVSKQPLSFPVGAGDVLTWQLFARTDRFEATKRCVLANHAGLEDEVSQRMETELTAMQPAELTLTAPPAAPKGPTVRVLVAAEDLKEGATLGSTTLQVVELPVAFHTESLIPESESEQVIGATTVTSLQAGDLVWWQHLQRADVIGPNVCVAKLEALTRTVREEYAARHAAAFEAEGATP